MHSLWIPRGLSASFLPAAALLLGAIPVHAQQPDAPAPSAKFVELPAQDRRHLVLSIDRMPNGDDGDRARVLVSISPDGCRYPQQAFGAPVQMDATSFHLKADALAPFLKDNQIIRDHLRTSGLKE